MYFHTRKNGIILSQKHYLYQKVKEGNCMRDEMDDKTKEALISALESTKAFGQKLQENREQRLWKKVNIPCSLFDAVNMLSKNEMDRIRKNLDLKNLSSLKKAELASELVKLIPAKFKQVIYTLDQGRYGLVKIIAKNSGVITDFDISASEAESLMGYSIIFPGVYNNQKVLFMPMELASIFLHVDGIELEKTVRRNTEWILLTHGLLYYYGVMDAWCIKEKVKHLTGQEVDIMEFMNVISAASDYYGQVRYSSYGYTDDRVFDAEKIVEEQKMRASVDYYPFAKQQLLKAGEPDYVDRTPSMNNFISFLLKHYNLNDEDTNEIALQLINMINGDSKPTTIIEYLQSWFEFPSFDFVQQLSAKIMELYNNTRQWVLKGHTPDELFQEEKKYLKPLPSEPIKLKQTDSKRTGQKVGRNDPCPCGSGKKYKKCCGR